MKLPILKCKRPGCQHEWIPRKPKMPKVCPACKQSDWNVKRPVIQNSPSYSEQTA